MARRQTLICLALIGTAAMPTVGWASSAERAAELFAEGRVLLAGADWDGALEAFADAAKADSENQEYRQQYALVRRVLKMRKSIDKEQDPERWATTARALRAFYHEQKIYAESLLLDRQIHTRLGSAESAAMLAETQLLLDMNAESAELLSGLDDEQATRRTLALLGVALARQGKTNEARGVANKCGQPVDASPDLCFDLARLHALLGDPGTALALLTRCFELTPPSLLERARARAKECQAFKSLCSRAAFAKALQAESKVKESGCSSGPSCGKCPSRAKCSKHKSSETGTQHH